MDMSDNSSSVEGGKKIILLCEKITREDIKVKWKLGDCIIEERLIYEHPFLSKIISECLKAFHINSVWALSISSKKLIDNLVSFSSIGKSLSRASYSIIGHKSYNTFIINCFYLGEILWPHQWLGRLGPILCLQCPQAVWDQSDDPGLHPSSHWGWCMEGADGACQTQRWSNQWTCGLLLHKH